VLLVDQQRRQHGAVGARGFERGDQPGHPGFRPRLLAVAYEVGEAEERVRGDRNVIPGRFVETLARYLSVRRSPPEAGTIAADGEDRGCRASVARERFRGACGSSRTIVYGGRDGRVAEIGELSWPAPLRVALVRLGASAAWHGAPWASAGGAAEEGLGLEAFAVGRPRSDRQDALGQGQCVGPRLRFG